MLIRKLAVPLINDKILAQAVHCYIATAGISDAGFDFIRSRIPAKCKIDVVTGLDHTTSPNVLKRIYSHYQERISLKVYTRGVLHANVYVFDLPFRKSVAFVGSGNFSLEGFKDQEELFWKITDPKEIESILSWFTGFYEFGHLLDEAIIKEYEPVYFSIRQREIGSMQEKSIALSAAQVPWDTIKFSKQYFGREDYRVCSLVNSLSEEESINSLREVLKEKISRLSEKVKPALAAQKLFPLKPDAEQMSDPKGFWFRYSAKESGFMPGIVILQSGLEANGMSVRFLIRGGEPYQKERAAFLEKLNDETYLDSFLKAFAGLGTGYTIEVAGVKKQAGHFLQSRAFLDFIKSDYSQFFPIILERKIPPGDPSLNTDKIDVFVINEFVKLKGILTLL